MSFIVEDGSGVAVANSYATIAFFTAYFGDRSQDVSAWTDEEKEHALVAATDYIDTRWGLRFLGRRQFLYLPSRTTLTLTGQPNDGETIIIDGTTYTFKDTVVDEAAQIEIAETITATLFNIIPVVNVSSVTGFLFADYDVDALTIYVEKDGVVVSETLANGSFDNEPSAGYSGKQQTLEFPRLYLRDRTGVLVVSVPERIKEAACEYAYRANSAALAPDPTINSTGLRLIGSRVKVGPIENETRFAEETSIQITKPYPAADRLLQEYIQISQVVRA